jgi:hypothetical protein
METGGGVVPNGRDVVWLQSNRDGDTRERTPPVETDG